MYSKLTRSFCFFFQAEDGIRDKLVTGVQTCALPISGGGMEPEPAGDLRRQLALEHGAPGDDDARKARHPGACDDRFEVVVEARVREIRADVGQLHAPSIRRSCSSRATPAVSRLSANAEPAP